MKRILLMIAMATPIAASGDELVLHFYTRSGGACPPCERWKQDALPKIQRTGIIRVITHEDVPGVRTPTFHICRDGRGLKWTGYLGWRLHRAKMSRSIGRLLLGDE